MSLSIATRLPPETIANIIRCIAWDIYRPSPEQYQIKASKKHLGTLSLTCRYWARLCRPHMFRHLTLRNRDDLNQFVWFIQAPSLVQPCLYDCSPHLTLELSGTWPAPWLHRTHAAFLGGDVTTDTVAKYFEILLALQSTSVEGSQDEAVKYAPRSLSTGLPRTLPGSMFPFNFIGLRDMRFRSIADVLRLIDSLPDLLLIRCTRVTFDDTSLFLPPAPARRRLKTIKLFRVSAAGGSSPDVDVRTVFALIGRGTRLSQQSLRPQLMGLNAWDAVQAIVSALVVEQSYERIHLKPDGNGLQATFYDEAEDIKSHGIDFDATKTLPGGAQLGITASITRVTINLGQLSGDDVKAVRWDAVDEAVLALRPSDGAILTTTHPDVFKWLLDVVPGNVVLPRLRETSALQIRYLDTGRDGYWSLPSILSTPEQYVVDGHAVTLSAAQRFELFVQCHNEEEGLTLLRRILADTSSGPSIGP